MSWRALLWFAFAAFCFAMLLGNLFVVVCAFFMLAAFFVALMSFVWRSFNEMTAAWKRH